MTLQHQLFFGFPVKEDFNNHLAKINPYYLSLFIKEEETCLQEVTFKGTKYLGRFLGISSYLSELESLETNIYSLLNKLVPEYPYSEVPLLLFTVST